MKKNDINYIIKNDTTFTICCNDCPEQIHVQKLFGKPGNFKPFGISMSKFIVY